MSDTVTLAVVNDVGGRRVVGVKVVFGEGGGGVVGHGRGEK